MILALLSGGITALAILLIHVPAFYVRVEEPPGNDRVELSNEFFLRECAPFLASFAEGKGAWQFTFTQRQLNSFFEEIFVDFGDAEQFRNVGITQPRVEFDEDRIRFGFRYGDGNWSTIVNYDLKVWIAKGDINALVIEFLRSRAGAMPVPSQQICQDIADLGRQHNIEVNWYRHHGNPVAVVKFQCDRPRPTAQLQAIEVATGKVTIRGVSFDPSQTPMEEPIRMPPVQVSRGP
jgi:hypothetical protein